MKNSEYEQHEARQDDQKPLRLAIDELRNDRSVSPLEKIWQINKRLKRNRKEHSLKNMIHNTKLNLQAQVSNQNLKEVKDIIRGGETLQSSSLSVFGPEKQSFKQIYMRNIAESCDQYSRVQFRENDHKKQHRRLIST